MPVFKRPASWPWLFVASGFYFSVFFEPWGPVFRYFGWLLCLVGLGWFCLKRKKPAGEPVIDPVLKYILQFVLLWSLFTTILHFEGWNQAIKGFSIPLEAVFGIWLAAMVSRRSGTTKFEWVWWISSTLLFSWTIAAVIFLGDPTQPVYKISVLSLYANTLGLYCIVTLPMSLSLVARRHEKRKVKFFSYALFLLNLVVLFLSFSSGAWIIGALELVFFFILVRRESIRLLKVVAVIVLSAMLLFILLFLFNESLYPQVRHEINQLLSFSEDFSRFTSKRSLIWEATTDLSLEKPLTGWSWTDFRVVFQRERGKLPGMRTIPYEPHNTYLDLLFAGGIPLFLAGTALFFRCAWLAWKKFREAEGKTRYMYAAVLTVIVNAMAYGFGGSIFAARHKVGFLFWVLFGIAAVREKGGPHAGAEVERAAPETS